SFSPVNYGYKRLSDLIRASELFDMEMRKTVMYFRDARK
ncbi:MAG TPA: OST-HTH/LOTUS domain-containing protein, partial [Candidatus Kapabacteria bacterium]|nr:OST-HTH/LOTUS domain-containing protein [Candidatus Kapabacteria bacterium]